jgi:hypothetical protein
MNLKLFSWRLALIAFICAALAIFGNGVDVPHFKNAALAQEDTMIGSGITGIYKPSGCAAVLSIDGTPEVSSQASGNSSVTFTWSNANDVLVALIGDNIGTDTLNASGAGLSWTAALNNTAGNTVAVAYAIAATAQSSQTISSTGVTGFSNILVFAVHGANISSPFDGSIATGTSVPGSITTSNAHDLIFASTQSNLSADSNYTLLAAANYLMGEYRVVSSTGTYSAALTGGGGWSMGAIKRSC